MKIYVVVHGHEEQGYVNVGGRFSLFDAELLLQERATEYGYIMESRDAAYGAEDGRWYLEIDEVDVS